MSQLAGAIYLLDHTGRVLHSNDDGTLSAMSQPAAISANERWLLHRVDTHYVALRSSLTGHWLCAEDSGRAVANRVECQAWEQWRLSKCGSSGGVALLSYHDRYLAVEQTCGVSANALSPFGWQLVWLADEADGKGSAISAANPVGNVALDADVRDNFYS